jgi:DNA adenine methylase
MTCDQPPSAAHEDSSVETGVSAYKSRHVPLERPILRYHGGKWLLAEWVIAHMPPHRVYVEPFGGAGSVLLRKPKSYAEVYNDKWSAVVNVFRVLRNPATAARLKHALEHTAFARDEFTDCAHSDNDDDVERARKTIFRSMAGFGSAASNGLYPTGFRANSNRSGTTPAQDWMNYPPYVDAYVSRLRGVVIENREAVEVMRAHDSVETLHYVDPPYVHATRNFARGNAAYAHELTDDQHVEMLAVLRTLTGAVLLSGYRNDLYDEYLADWVRVERAAHADGAADRIEVLWMNDRCRRAQRQQSLLT